MLKTKRLHSMKQLNSIQLCWSWSSADYSQHQISILSYSYACTSNFQNLSKWKTKTCLRRRRSLMHKNFLAYLCIFFFGQSKRIDWLVKQIAVLLICNLSAESISDSAPPEQSRAFPVMQERSKKFSALMSQMIGSTCMYSTLYILYAYTFIHGMHDRRLMICQHVFMSVGEKNLMRNKIRGCKNPNQLQVGRVTADAALNGWKCGGWIVVFSLNWFDLMGPDRLTGWCVLAG